MSTIRFLDHHVTDGSVKARVHYSIDNRAPGHPPCVTVYAKDYSRKLRLLFGALYVNHTDSQSDYFDEGHVTLEDGHPLYAAARTAALLAKERWQQHVERREAKRAATRQAKADTFRSRFVPVRVSSFVPVNRCGPDCDAMMQHTAECMASRP
jgi:hypothetical protein